APAGRWRPWTRRPPPAGTAAGAAPGGPRPPPKVPPDTPESRGRGASCPVDRTRPPDGPDEYDSEYTDATDPCRDATKGSLRQREHERSPRRGVRPARQPEVRAAAPGVSWTAAVDGGRAPRPVRRHRGSLRRAGTRPGSAGGRRLRQ